MNVNIQDPRTPINPSKPISPPYGFGKKPGVINLPGFYPRQPQNTQKIPNYQVLSPQYSQPSSQITSYKETTPLKLVPVKEVKDNITTKTIGSVITPHTTKATTTTKEQSDSENDLHSLESPVKSQPEFPNALIPILSVVVVFCTVGAVAVFFRKKIYLTKPKDSKKDMVSVV